MLTREYSKNSKLSLKVMLGANQLYGLWHLHAPPSVGGTHLLRQRDRAALAFADFQILAVQRPHPSVPHDGRELAESLSAG
jgi:hypothetical protein